ncbi:MAG TPA: nuclear transport factor 2 family protein [Cyclobacteriaceae bacterium]|nr:nuclear transport factor 2 family protein [Cyclobacteriaceae bacterium]HNP07519.1 nuclear transport factor 2 family protein [Cyclobacteriaceae bacterium]HRK53272.1 nuclear transport factor 2 family protein [Cyclobacteriaceae bacterium]
MDNSELIKNFYTAFQNKNWKQMQECYHEEVHFSDPVFPDLHGKKARAMWHMLTSASTDLTLTFSDIKTNSENGTCHWEAIYSFSKTGRKVHNKIDAHFTFKDGLILAHKDHFDLWKWSRMALGPTGTLLGWTPFIKGKIRLMAAKNLGTFISKNPIYS